MNQGKASTHETIHGGDVAMLSHDQWAEIRFWSKVGKSIKTIARDLCLSRNTVRKALRQPESPQYQRQKKQRGVLEPFLPFLQQRPPEVFFNATTLSNLATNFSESINDFSCCFKVSACLAIICAEVICSSLAFFSLCESTCKFFSKLAMVPRSCRKAGLAAAPFPHSAPHTCSQGLASVLIDGQRGLEIVRKRNGKTCR